jgi:hypothetical protein
VVVLVVIWYGDGFGSLDLMVWCGGGFMAAVGSDSACFAIV